MYVVKKKLLQAQCLHILDSCYKKRSEAGSVLRYGQQIESVNDILDHIRDMPDDEDVILSITEMRIIGNPKPDDRYYKPLLEYSNEK